MAARGAANNGGQIDGITILSEPYGRYDNRYSGRIRSVAVFGRLIRPTPTFSQSGHSYSSYSGSSSYQLSNNSGCSSASASAAAVDLGVDELTQIARQMASDGYTRCLVQAFHSASPAAAFRFGDGPVFDWLCELDFSWDLAEHPFLPPKLAKMSSSSLQESVERWIRALTVIAVSITELVVTVTGDDERLAVARFGKASMAVVLVPVDDFIFFLKGENWLQAMLHMHTCVSRAWRMFTSVAISPEAQSIFNEIAASLEKEVKRLNEGSFSAMEKVKTLMEDDDSWATEIPRGRGEVHRNTRLMVDYVLLSARVHDTEHLSDMTQSTFSYLNDLLLRKSELCSDPSLRYLFLLNNSYFAAQMIEPCQPGHDWKLTSECEKYMFTYLDVSWGHVLSCIPMSHFPRPLHRWISTSSLVKFESAFHRTYHAQKFWKVPDPRLRDGLRRAISAIVISGYRDYLGEHPELKKDVGHKSSSPEDLEKRLLELFEG